MQSKKIYKSVALFGLVLPATVVAQQTKEKEVFVNNGVISVANGGVMSTLYDFDNTVNGNMKNDGIVYYYQSFNNDNLYHHSEKENSSTAVFTKLEGSGKQIISGSKPSDFYHIVLNNPEKQVAFDLKNEANVYGSVDFQDGIVKVDSLQGMLTFHQGAQALQPSDKSHAEGFVEKIGNEEFQYPKGDKGMYRYARISAPEGEKDSYQGKYNTEDHNFFRVRS
ncbi:gliding motility-associated C-terminal domain-containing protein, partial [Myroides sp. BIT-d1]|nr:gliding motility-associated C-terminal domain-containing protein [Myroides albus]